MNLRAWFFDFCIVALHVLASAGWLLCLCYGATGQVLPAIIAGVVCAASIVGFHKLEVGKGKN